VPAGPLISLAGAMLTPARIGIGQAIEIERAWACRASSRRLLSNERQTPWTAP
jgi:hypothetical protein